jgi:DNA polymerase-3 subunit gamma/tau
VLAYLNASQNCVHLLSVPAVLTVPFAEEETSLARCYAAAGPARCREALAQVLALPEGTRYLAFSPDVLERIASRYGPVRVGFTGALTEEELARYGRSRVLDLFDMILRGAAAEALAELQAQYADGADPMAVLRDLAEITHWVSIVKITPEAIEDPTIGPDERARGAQIAEKIPMRALTRLWQMLLKALEEVGAAPNAMMAAEMAIIRLTHVADLPDPEALIRKVQASAAAGEFNRSAAPPAHRNEAPRAIAPLAPIAARPDGSAAAVAVSPDALAGFPDFESVIELIRRMRDMKLLLDVEDHLRLVRYAPGRIDFNPTDNAPRDFAQRLAERLRGWTGGQRWAVVVVSEPGQPTISEQRAARELEARARAMENPTVQAIFAHFPQAKITRIRPAPQPVAVEKPAGEDTSPHELTEGPVAEVEEWDPFEDEE